MFVPVCTLLMLAAKGRPYQLVAAEQLQLHAQRRTAGIRHGNRVKWSSCSCMQTTPQGARPFLWVLMGHFLMQAEDSRRAMWWIQFTCMHAAATGQKPHLRVLVQSQFHAIPRFSQCLKRAVLGCQVIGAGCSSERSSGSLCAPQKGGTGAGPTQILDVPTTPTLPFSMHLTRHLACLPSSQGNSPACVSVNDRRNNAVLLCNASTACIRQQPLTMSSDLHLPPSGWPPDSVL